MANTFSTISPGQIINETYRVLQLLGQGGMGAVFAAEHLRLPGKRVAVKVLHPSYSAGEVLLRFRREAEIASRIGHPNIVEVMDFNNLPDGSPYLVMELLAGESLAARLKRGPISEPVALSIARQIGSALDSAHRQSVVHRDLKPDNVFLCPRDVDGEIRDHVKVLDFGISKIRGSQTVVTQDAAVMGTPHYMSPEQATGKNQEIDGRTDVFALGAIVFEMLSGKIAFPGDTFPAVIYRVVFEPHPALAPLAPQASSRVIAAVDKALAKKVGDRFPDMNSFVLALTGKPLGGTIHPSSAGQEPGIETMETLPPPAQVSATEATMASLPAKSPNAPYVPLAPTMPSLPNAGVAVMPTQAAPSTAVAKKKNPMTLVAIGAVAVALGLGALVVMRKPPRPPSEAVALSPSVQPKPEAPAQPPVSPDTRAAALPDPAPEPEAPLVIVPGDKPASATKPNVTSGKSPAKEEALPPAVMAELDAATAALAANNAKEAIRLAKHSLFTQKSSRAFAIIARASCMLGDLGGAQAALRNVSGAHRGRVVKDCKAAGVNL